MDTPYVRDAVAALLAAKDSPALRACLMAHPDELLSPEACDLIAEAESEKVLPRGPLTAGVLREMLAYGRTHGLFPVLKYVVPLPQDVLDAVGAYLDAENWHYVFRELQKKWDLLTDDAADLCMENLLASNRGDAAKRSRIDVARRLAQVGRADGPDGARQWLLAQLLPRLGNPPAATVAVLGLQPPDMKEWRQLLSLHVETVCALPNPFPAVEETLDLLNCFLVEPLARAPVAAQIAAKLAEGELCLFRRGGEREQNRSRALQVLNEALSSAEHAKEWGAAARAHYLLARAWAQRQTNRAGAFRRALNHLEKAAEVPESANVSDARTDVGLLKGACLRGLAARTPDGKERKALLLRAVATLESALAGVSNQGLAAGLKIELAQAQNDCAEFEPSRRPPAVELARDVATSPEAAGSPFDRAYYQSKYGEIALAQRRADPSFDLMPVIEVVKEAQDVFERLSLPPESAWSAELLGDIYLSMSRWDDALASYRTVMTLGDALYEGAFTVLGREVAGQSQSTAAAKIGFCLCKVGRPSDALMQSEQTKLRIVLEALEREDLAAADLPQELRQNFAQALSDLRALETEARQSADTPGRRPEAAIGEALREADARLDRLRAAARASGWSPAPFALTAQLVLEVLPPGGAALAPLITPVGTALIILREGATDILPDDVRYLPLTFEELMDVVSRYAIFMAKRRVDPADAAPWLEDLTGRLWDRLMGPIAKELDDLKLAKGAPVMLVSQGGLAVLPLIAAASAANPQHPFGVDYAVTCIPGLSVIAYLRRRRSNDSMPERRVTAVIDPSENLRFARLEGALIRNFVGAENWTAVEGQEATAARVQEALSAATHIHFACHGRFDFANPWASGLVMADGQLQASQIAFQGAPRSLELVVLSACETGVSGFREAPDEYGGLPAAFLVSGAKAVVSSLWAVNDVSSALLISEFYRLHFDEGRGIQTALREAQLWLRGATACNLRSWLGARARSCKLLSLSGWKTRFQLWRLRRGLAKHDPSIRPFAGADQWAAFVALTASLDRAGGET